MHKIITSAGILLSQAECQGIQGHVQITPINSQENQVPS